MVRSHVFEMVKVYAYTETRPDLAYAHYYSTLNLGDKFQLRKAVVRFHISGAWRSRRFSLRSLMMDLFSVPYLSSRFLRVAVPRSANFQRFAKYIPTHYIHPSFFYHGHPHPGETLATGPHNSSPGGVPMEHRILLYIRYLVVYLSQLRCIRTRDFRSFRVMDGK